MTPIKAPTGVWYIAGWKIPYCLAYVRKDGAELTSTFIEDQLRLPASYRSVKTRTFASEREAWLAIDAWQHGDSREDTMRYADPTNATNVQT
jgi:hypothetical protein